MTIEQVKLLRDKLELKIEGLIRIFNDETQVFVESVEVSNKFCRDDTSMLVSGLNRIKVILEKL